MSIFVVEEDRWKLRMLKQRLSARNGNGLLIIDGPVPLGKVMEDLTLTVVSECGRTATLHLDDERLIHMRNQSACIVRVYPHETSQGVNIHLNSGCVTFCAKEPLNLELRGKQLTTLKKRPATV